jgi:superfamily II DNA helicase RecQ
MNPLSRDAACFRQKALHFSRNPVTFPGTTSSDRRSASLARRAELNTNLKSRAEGLLKQSLNDPHAAFRDGQWEAVLALVRDKSRLLVVQRTGWGKSLVYFLATR